MCSSDLEVKANDDVEAVEEQNRRQSEQDYEYQSASTEPASALATDAREASDQTPYVRDGRKIGRNEPCPCGSGKKYKQCHGKLS